MTNAPHLNARQHGVFIRLAEGQTVASIGRNLQLNESQVAYTALKLRRIFGIEHNSDFARIYRTPNAWRYRCTRP